MFRSTASAATVFATGCGGYSRYYSQRSILVLQENIGLDKPGVERRKERTPRNVGLWEERPSDNRSQGGRAANQCELPLEAKAMTE